jgi:ABC-type transport system involved in cytochrome bd biosynthesis fused ATPase/permease subunit
MYNALHTKLLLIIIALLASIASYLGYEKHKQDVAEERAQQFARRLRPDEKQAIDDLKSWGKKAREYRPK